MDKKKVSLTNILIPVLAVAAFFLPLASYEVGLQNGRLETKNIVITGLKNAETPEDIKEDFTIFWEAWNTLKTKHVNAEHVSDRIFIEGAIEGLAGALGDPYTTYFNQSDSQKFNEDVKGAFGGIGAEIGLRNDQLIIIAPLKDTPAERAELKAKDRILAIDGKSTSGLTVEGAVKLIRGTPGTVVTLTIFRDDWERSREIEITREVIKIPTLEYEVEGQTLIVNLYSFNENSESLFAGAIQAGLRQGAKSLVLDLRNNPGGYLDVAIRLAGWFLDRGSVVVKEKFASGEEELLRTYGNARLVDMPVVILINGGSASASEILAGALRDGRGIKLVGEKSFGKGTVQELVELSDGSLLKITIANWLTPKGTVIDKNGLEPDYKVEISDEDVEAEKDPQLDKAKELLKSR